MKVFISYRACQPDIELARYFHRELRKADHQPFMAQETIEWGDDWAADVDAALDECDSYLLLLSNDAAKSDAVLEEVETIHKRVHGTALPRPRVYVLKVRLTERPGFDLRVLIRRYQHRDWNSDADTAAAVSDLLEQLRQEGAVGVGPGLDSQWPSAVTGTPSPTAELPGGQLGVDSDLYQSREGLDAPAFASIVRQHALLRIKGPRQVGKTSLLARIQVYAARQGYRCASLSMQLTGSDTRRTTEALLRWFCKSLATALALPVDPPGSFGFGGPVLSCGEFLEQAILRGTGQPVVIALDELESVLDTPPVAADFLDMLRAWNQRALHEPLWNKLRLVVAYSTESSLTTGSQTTSPLENVGQPITLRDFSRIEVSQLASQFARHGREPGAGIVSYIFDETNGHPYLSSVALYQWSVNGIPPEASLSWTAPGPIREHLIRLLKRIRRAPESGPTLFRICQAEGPILLPDIEETFTLEGAGLVRVTPEGGVLPRCRLYRNFFGRNLAKAAVS